MNILVYLEDTRTDYRETRYRAWGVIDEAYYCLAFTMRKGSIRAISLPPEILSAFPRTRGKGVKPCKIPVSIRLSVETLEHYKSTGPGWQTRIEDTLRAAAGLASTDDTPDQRNPKA